MVPHTDPAGPSDTLDEEVRDIRFDRLPSPESLKLEKRGTTPQWRPTELWTPTELHRQTVAYKLHLAGMDQDADVLAECHTRVSVARCYSCHRTKRFLNRCERFYCPSCQPRLSAERKETVEWWTKKIDQPKHVVLTIRNTPDLTKDHVRHLKDSFTRLRRSKLCSGWKGGFYSVEVTNEGRGWHLHLHILTDARWIPADQLAVAWNKATKGQGHIVKVKDCRDREYLQEVSKYAVKGTDLAGWTHEDVATFVRVFTGLRTFGVFGLLFRMRSEWRQWLDSLQSEQPACECGCVDFVIVSEQEQAAWELDHGPPSRHPVECKPVSRPPDPELPLSVPVRFTLPD